ncbi:cystin-1 [Sorex araneus]|uniref:cystin-1 n=1 Tax=Sorex araneus TaxID=42254 RepID=UPI002433C06A|nr:cystin-1 [Sorex araneus]
MGSGSSRSGRALQRLRGSDRRPAGRSGAAPEAGTGPDEAPGGATAAGGDPGPAAAPESGDDTLRLLDQLLAESAAWGSGEPTPRRPARPPAAAGAGSRVTPEDGPGSGSVRVLQSPGGSQEGPERQLAVLYDCSEEELMASIEREYGS